MADINSNKEYIPDSSKLSSLMDIVAAANNNISNNIVTDDLVEGLSVPPRDNLELPKWSNADIRSVSTTNENSLSDLMTLKKIIDAVNPNNELNEDQLDTSKDSPEKAIIGSNELNSDNTDEKIKSRYLRNIEGSARAGTGLAQFGANTYRSSMYGGGNSNFSGQVATLPQILSDLSMRGFFFGYYYYPGFSMTREDSPWYITLSRHGYNDDLSGNDWLLGKLDRSKAGDAGFFMSKGLERLPRYVGNFGSIVPQYFDFSTMAPCIGCSINLGESRMAKIDLFRGQSFDVPDGFNVGSPQVKLQMIDDEHGSLRKYLMRYQKRCYDLGTNTVVNWRDVVWDINIIILRPGPEVDYKYTFYGILQDFDYQFNLERNGVGDMSIIDMPFSIVGARVSKNDKIYRPLYPGFVPFDNEGVATRTINMKDISVFKVDK